MRSAFVLGALHEDRLAEAALARVAVVILGAGWILRLSRRLCEGDANFEVDHPGNPAWKRGCLAQARHCAARKSCICRCGLRA